MPTPASFRARLPLALAALVITLLALPAAAVFPKPEAVTPGDRTLCLSRNLEWSAVGYTSDILAAGFERYTAILKAMPLGLGVDAAPATGADGDDDSGGGAPADNRRRRKRRCHVVETVEVSVTSSDQSLNLETRESYSLEIASPAAMIQANSVYGALRAMETLAQLARRRAVRCSPEGGPPAAAGGGSAPAGACTVDDGSEEEVPAEAIWPAEGDEEGASQGSAQPSQQQLGAVDRRHRKHPRTVLLVEETAIYDAPRFRYRGLLLDTARHFLPVSVIKAHLDAMTMVKMNCLHWHIVDDQSFPWQSDEIPELSDRGAFAPEAVYTAADVKEVVEYARFRGIRVIPELDTPGHTQSWGKSHPELLTECYNTRDGGKAGRLGPINPARNESYGFMWQLLREAARQFPDPYIHLGGDEVEHDCWKSNPEVQDFMGAKGFGADYAQLEGYWMEQVVQLAAAAGKNAIVWQEAFDNGDTRLPAHTRVQVWKWWKEQQQQQGSVAAAAADAAGEVAGAAAGGASSEQGSSAKGLQLGAEAGAGGGGGALPARRRALQAEQAAARQQALRQQGSGCDPGSGCAAAADNEAWKEELAAVTKAGYDAILSAPWYLNRGCYAGEDWKAYYAADPHDFEGTQEQLDHILGGEACAWGEFIDAVNSINRVWPRAAAVAERLWSPRGVSDVDDAAARLADLRCRMLSRGVAAQSMGPGFCPGELTMRM